MTREGTLHVRCRVSNARFPTMGTSVALIVRHAPAVRWSTLTLRVYIDDLDQRRATIIARHKALYAKFRNENRRHAHGNGFGLLLRLESIGYWELLTVPWSIACRGLSAQTATPPAVRFARAIDRAGRH